MTLTRWLPATALLLAAAYAQEARAHFLFVRIGPMAEAGRAAEVYFSEQAEAGDPRFVEKITQTKLWVQTEPGQFRELTVRPAADRLRATLPAGGSLSVVGACEYGVLARPNQASFLLRHYPKAVAGAPGDLNALALRPEIPLEIVAHFDADRVRLTAMRQGKPLPDAVFHTIDMDLNGGEVKAGADGAAVWKPPVPGHYSIYVSDTRKEPGTHDGKPYDEIREFATLAFAWPLMRKGADPQAVALFQEALSARAAWNDFTGFSAAAAGSVDGRPFTGKVTAQADGTVKVEVDDPVARPWLEDQLGSLVMHRMVDSTSDSTPVLRFGDEDEDHPLGRLLVFEGGRFASSYRVKDRQIMVVNRHIGRRNMTITMLENEKNADGKFLPRRYLVHYWNAADGRLDRVETVQQRWKRVGAWDLPVEHSVTYASETGLTVRQVKLDYK